MRTVVQRVARAAVRVGDEVVGAIERGLVLLVGVEKGDGEAPTRPRARSRRCGCSPDGRRWT
jgi:D-aminoacyl-tRNA deacylase